MPNTQTFICGHKNPDTDSVCAAYCYAVLKNKLRGAESTTAIRCGQLNRQTEYIFGKVGVTPPAFVKNIHLCCADVMNAQPDAVHHHAPLGDVFHLLDEKHIHAVPVVDAASKYLGLVNINMLTKRFLGFGHGRTEIVFSAHNISQVLETPALTSGTSTEGTFSLVIGALPLDGFRQRLDTMHPENVMLVVGERPDIIAHALSLKVAAIVLTGTSDAACVRSMFGGTNTWVFASKFDTIETYRRLMLSMPVQVIMSTKTPTLRPASSLAEASAIFTDHALRGIPIVEDGRLAGLVTRTDLLSPRHKKLILVDHNELAQAVGGAEEADIVEIVDHHRIGALTTSSPINIYAKPVGSTCTLVFEKFCMHGVPPSQQEAALLLSGIVSDTLALRSPTATDDDRDAVKSLCLLAGLTDWVSFADDIFSNTHNLLFENLSQVIEADLKTYTEKGLSVGIAQIEVMDIDEANAVRGRLAVELESMRKARGLDWAMLLVTDIIHANSGLITSGSEEADSRLKYTLVEKRYFALPGVLSRKKQLLPEVLRVIDDLAAGTKRR